MAAPSERVAAARRLTARLRDELDAARRELHEALQAEHRAALDVGQTFACPRRVEGPGMPTDGSTPDYYEVRGKGRACCYCGSMLADTFMEGVRAGVVVEPTDKTYKAYVGGQHAKFYYQHLSDEQQVEFVELHNARKVNWGAPGYPYVLPFFMRAAAAGGGQ